MEPNFQCIGCNSHDDCISPPNTLCVDSTCVQCTEDAHCFDPTPLCNLINHECVECLDNTPCDDLTACNGQEQCASGTCQPGTPPMCDNQCRELSGNGFECVQCLDDGHCEPGKQCSPSIFTCVDCLDSMTCDDNIFCNGVETCSQNGTCLTGVLPCESASLLCDEAGSRCVQCLNDTHCSTLAENYCDGLGRCRMYAHSFISITLINWVAGAW